MASPIVAFERIRAKIIVLRGHRVMLSTDLAELYGVETKALVQAVKRNLARFPADFRFQLTEQESKSLRSQIVTSKAIGRGGARHPPLAFTEQGVAMLSSVLKSKRAVEMSIAIVRAFVQLRQWIISNKDLAGRLAELEKKYDLKFETVGGQLKIVFDALQELMEPPSTPPKRLIGFKRQR